MEKAQRGFDTVKNVEALPVLGSDTIVEIGGIGWASQETVNTQRILTMLSGQMHEVHTSVADSPTQERKVIETSSTHVHFKTLEADEIDSYINTGERQTIRQAHMRYRALPPSL